jgi:hypothetical protein
MESLARTALERITRPPVVLTSTEPPDEVRVVLAPVVICPDPRRTILLTAWIAPVGVGSTVVPPEMVMLPAELSCPVPE